MKNTALRMVMICVIIACLSFVLFSGTGGTGSHLISELFNFGHFPLFGVISVAVFIYIELGRQRGLKNLILAWFITILLGGSVEIIQLFQDGRSCEFRDFVNDTLGALAFLAFTYALLTDNKTRRNQIILSVVILSAAASIPVWIAVAEWREMNRVFPIIASFENNREMRRWSANHAVITPIMEHASHGLHAARIHLSSGTYPGISSSYFIQDWRGYESLSFDVYLEDSRPLKLVIRVHDNIHNWKYTDRFNRSFTVQPGINHIVIALSDVQNAPANRSMDMRRVANICIFTTDLRDERILLLDNIRLNKDRNAQK